MLPMTVCLSSPDIVAAIFKQLHDPVELSRLARVCKLWNHIAMRPVFWQVLSFRSRVIQNDKLLALLARHNQHISHLHLSQRVVPQLPAVLRGGLSYLTRLEDLTLDLIPMREFNSELRMLLPPHNKRSVPKEVLEHGIACLQEVHSLRSLTIQHLQAERSEGLINLEFHHQFLQKLVLRYCICGRVVFGNCPCLHTLSVEGSNIDQLVRPPPTLTDLNLTGVTMSSDELALLTTSQQTALTRLSCRGILSSTDRFMEAIRHCLPSLTWLDMSGNEGKNLATLNQATSLRVLVAQHCDDLKEEQLQSALQSCWNLEEVYLDRANGVECVRLQGLPSLRLLSLRSCPSLHSVNAQCYMLRELRLGKMNAKCTVECSVQSVYISSQAMTRIHWNDLPCLETIQLDCPSLTSISLTDCPKISDRTVASWSNDQLLTEAPGIVTPCKPPSGYRYVGHQDGVRSLESQHTDADMTVGANGSKKRVRSSMADDVRSTAPGAPEVAAAEAVPPPQVPSGSVVATDTDSIVNSAGAGPAHVSGGVGPSPRDSSAAAECCRAEPTAAAAAAAAAAVFSNNALALPRRSDLADINPVANLSVQPLSSRDNDLLSSQDAPRGIGLEPLPANAQLSAVAPSAVAVVEAQPSQQQTQATSRVVEEPELPSLLPALQELRLHGCCGLRHIRLAHKSLRSLSVRSCSLLTSLALACPQLSGLDINDCEMLKSVGLGPVALPTLCLGAVLGLEALRVSSTALEELNLQGCVALSHLELPHCSRLTSIDTEYCSALDGAALLGAVRDRPPLRRLVYSTKSKLGEECISALRQLEYLTSLDLSYTDVSDVSLLANRLTFLKQLSMVACPLLDADSLVRVLAPTEARVQAPPLEHLDCSYCPLQRAHVLALVTRCCCLLKSLALNGVVGVDDTLWETLDTTQPLVLPHLETLSLVRCPKLTVLCLGLKPRQHPQVWSSQQYNRCKDQPVLAESSAEALEWKDDSVLLLPKLKILRLQLSRIQVLAVRAPCLTELNLNSCAQLRALSLCCDALTSLSVQACAHLPRSCLVAALENLPALTSLDVQYAAQLQFLVPLGAHASVSEQDAALRPSSLKTKMAWT